MPRLQLFKQLFFLACVVQTLLPHSLRAQESRETAQTGSMRIATYNVSLNRPAAGQLANDLQSNDKQIAAVAAVIRDVRPDILLLNELDFDEGSDNAGLFEQIYLANEELDALGNGAWPMPHRFTAPVNTGVPSGLDINQDGQKNQPVDAWGFGAFPGQYGMAVLSRYPIDANQVQTFQKLRWSELPNPTIPIRKDGQPYYAAETWKQLRISSKSFWDVPITTQMGTLHLLASHPTPPSFDGPEDHNGCRNHDEIKLLQTYFERSHKLLNDRGETVSLREDAAFVVAGDLNCDPMDGESQRQAIVDVLQHRLVSQFPPPRSRGASLASGQQAGMNQQHRSEPDTDTADFNDQSVGNLRVDYVLPSIHFTVAASGVYWPALEEVPVSRREATRSCLQATDHHLVWVDVEWKKID